MKKIVFTIGCLLAVLSGCEKAVDVDVPFEDPKLVLNGFMNPDSSFTVHVSKSQFVLDMAELKNITDASVRIYEGDRLLGEMVHQTEGLYRLEGVFPEPGKTYSIQAEKQGFNPVNATEKVLRAVILSDLKIDTVKVEDFGAIRMDYDFSLEDPAGEKNYYLIGVTEKGMEKYSEGRFEPGKEPEWKWRPYSRTMRTESTDPLLENYCLGYNGCGLLMTDEFIDGKAYRIKLKVDSYNSGYNQEYNKDVETFLTVYQIPESYYRYIKTLEQNENVRDNPFAEPAKVFSNVEGGYGIWASLTLSRAGSNE